MVDGQPRGGKTPPTTVQGTAQFLAKCANDSGDTGGDFHSAEIGVEGLFILNGSGHDVTMGNISSSGEAVLGDPVNQSTQLHDFKVGDISGKLGVAGTFHDGTVGHISGYVQLHSIGHQFKTASTAPAGFTHTTPDFAATSDGGTLVLESMADERKVQFAP